MCTRARAIGGEPPSPGDSDEGPRRGAGPRAGRPRKLGKSPPVLHIHRAERADRLADALAALCAEPLDDPFAAEVVAVPTRGMERWLTQRMSTVLGASSGRADGICADVQFPFPNVLIADAVARASGIDPLRDPWLPERATWPLLEVVEQWIDEPWLQSLATYLGRDDCRDDPVRHARRLSVVRHLARLFDRYALHRPEMLDAWAAGRDTDSVGGPLARQAVWQAELWRRLRARIAVPGPAERRLRACERLADDRELAELPDRFSLFGLTRLPAGHLQVLRALARAARRAPVPAAPVAALWEKVAGRPAPGEPVIRRADDPTAGLAANRLLASWGRDSREMQLVLAAAGTEATTHRHTPRHARPPRRRCSAGSRTASATTGPRPGAPLPGQRDRRPLLEPDDRVDRDPLLPRPGAAGRGDPRRDPARAGRGREPRAARRDRHVPGHRDVRAADPGHVRRRRGDCSTSDAGAAARRPAGRDRPAGPARRPLAAPDQPGARRRLGAARARPAAADRLAGARPRRPGAGPPALSLRRRRPRAAPGLDLAGRDPLGPRRAAPRAVQARGRPQRHVAGRASSGCCSG